MAATKKQVVGISIGGVVVSLPAIAAILKYLFSASALLGQVPENTKFIEEKARPAIIKVEKIETKLDGISAQLDRMEGRQGVIPAHSHGG
jgi:hypothetical protein